MKSDY